MLPLGRGGNWSATKRDVRHKYPTVPRAGNGTSFCVVPRCDTVCPHVFGLRASTALTWGQPPASGHVTADTSNRSGFQDWLDLNPSCCCSTLSCSVSRTKCVVFVEYFSEMKCLCSEFDVAICQTLYMSGICCTGRRQQILMAAVVSLTQADWVNTGVSWSRGTRDDPYWTNKSRTSVSVHSPQCPRPLSFSLTLSEVKSHDSLLFSSKYSFVLLVNCSVVWRQRR